MSLGLLAKDSIQDLEAFGREAAKEEELQQQRQLSNHDDNTADKSHAVVGMSEDLTTTTITTESTDGGAHEHENDPISSQSGDTMMMMTSSSTTVTSQSPSAMETENVSATPQENQQQAQSPSNSQLNNSNNKRTTSTLSDPSHETNYGKYSEFSSAYYDPYHYNSDYYMTSYSHSNKISAATNGFWQSLLPCLFPWTTGSLPMEEEDQGEQSPTVQPDKESEAKSTNGASPSASETPDINMQEEQSVMVVNGRKLQRAASSGDSDDVSTGSDALGEKLSSRERHAMLAKLGFPPPEAETDGDEEDDNDAGTDNHASPKKKAKKQRGLLNDLPQYDPATGGLLPSAPSSSSPAGAKTLKGILKRGSVPTTPSTLGLSHAGSSGRDLSATANRKHAPQRRSLFPQTSYESTTMKGNRPASKPVSFAPMARVVTVKSKNDMDDEEKGSIWWQKADYDDFRRTGRIITRAMLEGGSEVWLNSERCTGHKTKAASSTTPTNGPEDSGARDPITATGDKWWHKFGHSRRGLEHVVSVEEGKQRQLNVRSAIRATIDEQTRQRMYNRVDPEKIRMVSLQYTSWARDLALASGSSDADAVKSSFSNARKTREFFLLKMARTDTTVTSTDGSHVPEFMQPSLHVPSPHRLDAHTSAQIRFRRQSQIIQQKQPQQQSQQHSSSTQVTSTTTTSETTGSTVPSSSSASTRPSLESQNSFRTDAEGCEPVHDREDESSSNMARRAAGFSVGDGVQRVDMSAVLSGMGAVPRSSPPQQVLSSPA